MSISEFLDRWLADYAKHKVSPKTYERYQEMIDGHIRPAFGSYLLPKPPPLHIHCEPAPAINAVVIHLPDVGVFGNTHYAMSDTNITQVSAVVSLWLKNQGLDK